jgi:hypothetical protein
MTKGLQPATIQQLIKVIMTIAHEEQSVESLRVELCGHSVFMPYSGFQRLDRDLKGLINSTDIKNFLEYYSGS